MPSANALKPQRSTFWTAVGVVIMLLPGIMFGVCIWWYNRYAQIHTPTPQIYMWAPLTLVFELIPAQGLCTLVLGILAINFAADQARRQLARWVLLCIAIAVSLAVWVLWYLMSLSWNEPY